MNSHTRFVSTALCLSLAICASACAGSIKNMRAVAPGSPEPRPAPGKALVVFMRPSGTASGVQSSVFAMRDKQPELVGILASKAKVAWQADPGKQLFMVVSESGDFLGAELVAGRTYYALVTPRMGVWKARFSLRAVTGDQVGSQEFNAWASDCRWVEKEAASEDWARSNAGNVQAKYAEYYPEWMKKAENDRPWLHEGDGK